MKAEFTKIAGNAAAGLGTAFKKAFSKDARRPLFLIISLMLALNMIVIAIPYSPSAAAEGTETDGGASVSTFDDLQAALEDVSAAGDVTVTLGADIPVKSTLRPIAGKKYTVNGGGHKLYRDPSFKDGALLIRKGKKKYHKVTIK